MEEISIPITKPGNIITELFLRYMPKQRGRGWLLKKLINLFPGLNNAALVFDTLELPLDLRNNADIGYFYGQGISHERFFKKLLISLVNEKIVFYDIGSNIGYYSLLLSRYINQIYAFEPNPILVSRFKNVIKTNQIENIELFNVGLSGQNSRIPFYFDSSSHDLGTFIKPTNISKQIAVEVKTLNNIIEENGLKIPGIIKIDTEGLELDILEGYTLIHDHKPIILLEWLPNDTEEEKMLKRLNAILNEQYCIYRVGIDDTLTDFKKQDVPACNLLLLPNNSNKFDIIEKWII